MIVTMLKIRIFEQLCYYIGTINHFHFFNNLPSPFFLRKAVHSHIVSILNQYTANIDKHNRIYFKLGIGF